MKKGRTSRIGIIVTILLLSVGFAAITTTLYINGTAKITPNDDDFKGNVVFDKNATYTYATTGSTATVSEDGKTITFTTAELTSIGDTATLNFRIANKSQYNAVLGNPAIVCTQTGATTDDHIVLIPGTAIDGKTIPSKNGYSDESTVTVKMVKSYTGDENDSGKGYKSIQFQCTIAAEATEAN